MSSQNHETEFMSELEAAVRLKPHLAANVMLVAVTAMVVLFIIWASVSEVEEITRGAGQVVPSRENQIVQSLEGGILAELLVQEGDRVAKDQVLMRISDVFFASEGRGAEAKSLSLRAKKARLTAEAEGTDFAMPADITEKAPDIAANEEKLYRSRQQELANAIAILDDKIDGVTAEIAETNAHIRRLGGNSASLNKELKITEKMVQQKALPELEEIRLRRELSDVYGQTNAYKEKLTGLESELSSAKKERDDQSDKFRSQALGELGSVETDLKQLEESMKSIEDRVYRTELRAPVTGIVNNISLKTIGGVIEPAQQLVEIVPTDDEVKITARVSPSDIAFLQIGQPVKIKISAYDTQRYGALKGRLVRISANSNQDREGNSFFEIDVKSDRNYLGSAENPLPVTPGMQAETEIITGKRTIMDYLLKPIKRGFDRALRER